MATTKTFVQADATIISVTHLTKGDVYKRLEKDYSGTYTLKMGVVTDVLNNGEDTVITALEYEVEYSSSKTVLKVFGTDTDLKLFATDPEEVFSHMDDLKEQSGRQLSKARNEVQKLENFINALDGVVEQANQGTLSAAATKVLAPASE